jgi:hypothetical protein
MPSQEKSVFSQKNNPFSFGHSAGGWGGDDGSMGVSEVSRPERGSLDEAFRCNAF